MKCTGPGTTFMREIEVITDAGPQKMNASPVHNRYIGSREGAQRPV